MSTHTPQPITHPSSTRTADCSQTPSPLHCNRLRGNADLDAQPRKLSQVGVKGTGADGAGLTRYLHEHNVEVLEVPRPDRRLRRQRGKSDPIDAEAAARTLLAGRASGAPKLADGPIEAIRMLRVARSEPSKLRPLR